MFPLSLANKLIGLALLFAALSSIIYGVYNHIKQIGINEANVKCEARYREYEKERDEKLASIEKLIGVLAQDGKKSSLALSTDINAILKNSKSKPLVIVKDGGCVPSKDFSDSLTLINKRVNQSIQGTQK